MFAALERVQTPVKVKLKKLVLASEIAANDLESAARHLHRHNSDLEMEDRL